MHAMFRVLRVLRYGLLDSTAVPGAGAVCGYGCVFDQLESGLKCVILDAIASVALPRFFS